MSARASGTFQVTMNPQPPYDTGPGASLGRITLSKQFQGDLEGTGTAEMTSAMSEVQGSAGYVAIERITGTLHGRTGTFVLQHSGTMNRGQPTLNITVVPDTGTGALKGLSGQIKIDIVEGKHFYTFDYALEPAA